MLLRAIKHMFLLLGFVDSLDKHHELNATTSAALQDYESAVSASRDIASKQTQRRKDLSRTLTSAQDRTAGYRNK